MSDEAIKRKLFLASPAGRLKVHLQNLADLEKIAGEMPDGFDLSTYRRWIEFAADRIECGRSPESVQYLKSADLAFAKWLFLSDPDRLRGEKQRGNQYHPTGPTPETEEIIRAMRPLIGKGYSQIRAGGVVATKNKLGTSGSANKKLWTKWGKETGD